MNVLMTQLQRDLGEDFEFVRPLGDGTFSEVFLAREKRLDRPVTVKVLRRSLAMDEVARQRFLREARLAARIKHPNVAGVHRVGELEADGRPYLVMEYIDGLTFDDVLAAEGPLPEEDVVQIIGELCLALSHAHALGIIHRDVRPGNIMRTRNGERVVLMDFGVAGVLETGGETVSRLTVPGEIMGRVGYAAPEQLSGETIRPGSDVYAVAVTAYELMTGVGPFPQAGTRAQTIEAHLHGAPTPIRRLLPSASAELEDLLLRCLHKHPDKRPAADLVHKRLHGEASGEEDLPTGAFDSFLAELKRRRLYKLGAAYGAFVLVVLALVDGALPALPFDPPDWVDTAAVMAALGGLPFALILGWFFDLRDGGVERTQPLRDGSPRGLPLIQSAALVAVLAVTGLLGWHFLFR
jgi:serine/threonine protein kinase